MGTFTGLEPPTEGAAQLEGAPWECTQMRLRRRPLAASATRMVPSRLLLTMPMSGIAVTCSSRFP